MAKIADRSEEITDKMWLSCNEFNRNIIDEYLDSAIHLSPKSHKQYRSALRIYANWIRRHCKDKPITEIKSRDYLRYQNWLSNNGLSEAAVRLKRTAVNNVNNFIMIYYEEEFPTFRNYINQQIKIPKTGFVHKKEPLNPDEYLLLCNEIETWRLAKISLS